MAELELNQGTSIEKAPRDWRSSVGAATTERDPLNAGLECADQADVPRSAPAAGAIPVPGN